MLYQFDFLDEVIHSDKFSALAHVIIDNCPVYRVLDTDCIVFCDAKCTGKAFEIIRNSAKRHILITHHYDAPVNNRLYSKSHRIFIDGLL